MGDLLSALNKGRYRQLSCQISNYTIEPTDDGNNYNIEIDVRGQATAKAYLKKIDMSDLDRVKTRLSQLMSGQNLTHCCYDVAHLSFHLGFCQPSFFLTYVALFCAS